MINKIVDYIIKETQENSTLSGFQFTLAYSDLAENFAGEMEEYIENLIVNELCRRKEIADITTDVDGFDVVLYTDYAPNYKKQPTISV